MLSSHLGKVSFSSWNGPELCLWQLCEHMYSDLVSLYFDVLGSLVLQIMRKSAPHIMMSSPNTANQLTV